MVMFYYPANAEDEEDADTEDFEEGGGGDSPYAPGIKAVTRHGGSWWKPFCWCVWKV